MSDLLRILEENALIIDPQFDDLVRPVFHTEAGGIVTFPSDSPEAVWADQDAIELVTRAYPMPIQWKMSRN